jgi:3-deoxy-manno-octulosonate cytidylyltransferase (CMP-KDO synthetase)
LGKWRLCRWLIPGSGDGAAGQECGSKDPPEYSQIQPEQRSVKMFEAGSDSHSIVVPSNVPSRVLGVIPARFASSRFPGKSLARIAGKSMLQHVWERASMARYLTSIVIATDDERIADEARSFRAMVRMTRPDHASGTDRVAEVASSDRAEYIVNIQGDEPLIDPNAIDAAILSLLPEPEIPMGTLKKRIEHPGEITNPNVVKVVTDHLGNAIYFSRSPIPYVRDQQQAVYFKHIGLYVYQRSFLLAYSDLSVGPLEQCERLEQLRAMENGYKIRVVETEYDSLGVDTPEDLEKVSGLFDFAGTTGEDGP